MDWLGRLGSRIAARQQKGRLTVSMIHDSKRLLINAGSNSAAFIAMLAVSFVLAPIVLQSLGDAQYGAWSFAESFVAYLTLFDMGVAAALVRFVPRALARDDIDQLTRYYSASLLFFVGGAIAALIIGIGFAFFVLDHFLKNGQFHAQFRGLFLILVLNFALTLPLSVYPALLDGLGRFTFKSLVRTGVLLARVPLTLAVIRTDSRLINLGYVILTCSLVESALFAAGVFHWLPGLRCRPKTVDRATIRQIAAYSRDAMAAMFAGRLAFHTDAFVIGPFLGAAAITPFSFPAKLVEMGKAVLRSATTTLTATFSSLEAAGEHDRLRSTFLVGSRAAWYAALPIQIGLFFLGPTFLRLWIGSAYAEAGTPVLLALASVLSLTIAQSVASRVLYGTGRLRAFAVATLGDGVANLALSLLLVGPLGILGVALGTAIPHAAFCLGIVVYVCRIVDATLKAYLRQLVGPLVAVVFPTAVWGTMAWRGINGWGTLFVGGLAGIAGHALVVLAIERRFNVIKMLRGKPQANPLPLRRAG
jgi:O-antigen/teichoic acid export membrane protein